MNPEQSDENSPRTIVKIATAVMLVLPLLFLVSPAGAGETNLWDSGSLAQGENWSHTFATATNDMYSCSPHPPNAGFPDFTGWVNVSDDANASADDVTVYIVGFSYSPRDILIKPGVTVTWVNNDSAAHTATQMDMGGGMDDDDHSGMDDDESTPGFTLGLAISTLMAAAIVAVGRKRD